MLDFRQVGTRMWSHLAKITVIKGVPHSGCKPYHHLTFFNPPENCFVTHCNKRKRSSRSVTLVTAVTNVTGVTIQIIGVVIAGVIDETIDCEPNQPVCNTITCFSFFS